MSSDLSSRERALTDKLDEARETIRQLRELLVPNASERYRVAGFSKTAAAVLATLSDGRIHSKERLRAVFDGINPTRGGGSLQSVVATVSYLRRRLRTLPAGENWVSILTHRGAGYSMTALSIANLQALAPL